MSRRFGRNQKRRLRAEIAAHEAAHDQLLTLLAYQREQRMQAETTLRYVTDAAERLRFSALLPAKRMRVDDPLGRFRLDVTPLEDFTAADAADAVALTSLEPVDLYALACTIEERPEEFSREVHFFAEGSGPMQGHWAYRVSERALHGGMSPDARRAFVEQIARALLARADCHFKTAR